MTKQCSKCKEFKSFDMFHKDKKSRRANGLYPRCKQCRKPEGKLRYKNNSEKIKEQSKLRYEKVKNTQEFKKQNRERQNNRIKKDPFYKIKRNLRNRLYYAILNTEWKKNTHFAAYIGCEHSSLISHLEKQFKTGMTWDNYGEWHIDHIIPLSSAKTEEELYELCHYTNLQPLWGRENIIKGSNQFSNYKIRLIESNDYKQMIEDNHYTNSIPSISLAYGLFENNSLVGVCTFGIPFSSGIRNLFPDQILELNRLVLLNNKKNEASFLISNSIKLLPNNTIIITYADPDQDHSGAIYKAANFINYGLTEKRKQYIIKGKNLHPLTLADLIKKDPTIKYELENRTQKHRFIFIKGNDKFKENCFKILNNKYKKAPEEI